MLAVHERVTGAGFDGLDGVRLVHSAPGGPALGGRRVVAIARRSVRLHGLGAGAQRGLAVIPCYGMSSRGDCRERLWVACEGLMCDGMALCPTLPLGWRQGRAPDFVDSVVVVVVVVMVMVELLVVNCLAGVVH